MEPFSNNFILNKIDKYNNKIKESKVSNYEVIRFDWPKGKNIEGYMYSKENTLDMKFTELMYKGRTIMSISPKEIVGSYESIRWASGVVGIVGLGLGYVANEMAEKEEVTEVIVYEMREEIIELYNNSFEKNDKIKIVLGDAYKAQSNKFDFFYVDTYSYKLTDKVVEDYKFFKRLHQIEDYSFFSVEHFLLSCDYTEIVWVYIPENWMIMCKQLSANMEQSGYIDYYKQLDSTLVSDVLKKFKVVLNEGEDEK